MTVEGSTRAIGEGRAASGAWGVGRGSGAVYGGAWRGATPDAYEGLGIAARYELDREAALEAHGRGYRLAQSAAIQRPRRGWRFSSPTTLTPSTGVAEASGWVERAASLVDGEPASVAAAARADVARCILALLADHDPELALRGVRAGDRALAGEVAAVDVEMFALALNGLSLVSVGEIEVGMRRIDAAAAAAVGGEMTDAD